VVRGELSGARQGRPALTKSNPAGQWFTGPHPFTALGKKDHLIYAINKYILLQALRVLMRIEWKALLECLLLMDNSLVLSLKWSQSGRDKDEILRQQEYTNTNSALAALSTRLWLKKELAHKIECHEEH
jgi:hypothetical protein